MSGSNGVIDFLVIYGQQAHGGEKSGDRLWGGFGARPRGQAQADTAAVGVREKDCWGPAMAMLCSTHAIAML